MSEYDSQDLLLIDIFSKKKASSTIKTYMKVIEDFKEFIGNKSFIDVTPDDATKFLEHLYKSKSYAKATLIRVRRTLLSLYNKGIEKEILEKNPIIRAKMPDENFNKQDIGYVGAYSILSLDDLQILLREAQNRYYNANTVRGKLRHIRNLTLILLFVECRFTALEANNFNWSDIEQDDNYNWAADIITKGGKKRIVPLSNDIINILKEYRTLLGLPLEVDKVKEFGNRVFLSKYDKPISDTGVRKIITKLCIDAGIKHTCPKDLGHMFGKISKLLNVDKDKIVLQAGVKSPTFVNKYDYVLADLVDPACNKVAEFVDKMLTSKREV